MDKNQVEEHFGITNELALRLQKAVGLLHEATKYGNGSIVKDAEKALERYAEFVKNV